MFFSAYPPGLLNQKVSAAANFSQIQSVIFQKFSVETILKCGFLRKDVTKLISIVPSCYHITQLPYFILKTRSTALCTMLTCIQIRKIKLHSWKTVTCAYGPRLRCHKNWLFSQKARSSLSCSSSELSFNGSIFSIPNATTQLAVERRIRLCILLAPLMSKLLFHTYQI